MSEQTLTVIIRILEECLDNEYTAEELQDKIGDVLRLLHVRDHAATLNASYELYSDCQSESV